MAAADSVVGPADDVAPPPRAAGSRPILLLWIGRLLVETTNGDAFQRIDRGVQVAPGKMQIHRGVLQLFVAHEELNRRQIGPALHQMVAKVWRRVCGPKRFESPDRRALSRQACHTALSVIGRSSSPAALNRVGNK